MTAVDGPVVGAPGAPGVAGAAGGVVDVDADDLLATASSAAAGAAASDSPAVSGEEKSELAPPAPLPPLPPPPPPMPPKRLPKPPPTPPSKLPTPPVTVDMTCDGIAMAVDMICDGIAMAVEAICIGAWSRVDGSMNGSAWTVPVEVADWCWWMATSTSRTGVKDARILVIWMVRFGCVEVNTSRRGSGGRLEYTHTRSRWMDGWVTNDGGKSEIWPVQRIARPAAKCLDSMIGCRQFQIRNRDTSLFETSRPTRFKDGNHLKRRDLLPHAIVSTSSIARRGVSETGYWGLQGHGQVTCDSFYLPRLGIQFLN